MNAQEFETLYDVKHIFNYTLDEARCHGGQAPTLRECQTLFGRDSLRKVMRGALDTFIDFIKAKDKPNNAQRDTICWLVMTQFGSLKITEWLLFAMKAMSGQFGKFYNTLDPLDITTAVRSWAKECETIRAELRASAEREQAQREREEQAATPIDREALMRHAEQIAERLKGWTK